MLSRLPYSKGLPAVWRPSFARVREIVAQRAPEIVFAEALPDGVTPHAHFLARIAAVRHLLMLSAAQGFGVVPLEAMAIGSLACGYDGFGERRYMRPDQNCTVAPYRDVERVKLRDTHEAFRHAWMQELRRVLHIEPQ